MKSRSLLFFIFLFVTTFCVSCQHERVFRPAADDTEINWANVQWTDDKIPYYSIDDVNVIQYSCFRILYDKQDEFIIPVFRNRYTGGAFWLTSKKVAYGQKFYCFAGMSTIPPGILSLDELRQYVVNAVPAGQYKVICSKVKWQNYDALFLQRVHRNPTTAVMVIEKGYYALNPQKTRSMISAGFGYQEYQNNEANTDLAALGEKFLKSVIFQIK